MTVVLVSMADKYGLEGLVASMILAGIFEIIMGLLKLCLLYTSTFQFASHTDNLHELSWNGKGKLTTVSEGELTEDVAVSYTHLDVYKRQDCSEFCCLNKV